MPQAASAKHPPCYIALSIRASVFAIARPSKVRTSGLFRAIPWIHESAPMRVFHMTSVGVGV
eukprot:12317014-Alexandrium_andersonii.AAC.1